MEKKNCNFYLYSCTVWTTISGINNWTSSSEKLVGLRTSTVSCCCCFSCFSFAFFHFRLIEWFKLWEVWHVSEMDTSDQKYFKHKGVKILNWDTKIPSNQFSAFIAQVKLSSLFDICGRNNISLVFISENQILWTIAVSALTRMVSNSLSYVYFYR